MGFGEGKSTAVFIMKPKQNEEYLVDRLIVVTLSKLNV
jgi:hypothetical protein